MNNEERWMNDIMAQVVWPVHSANLHDRIMARVDNGNILPFGFRRPGLKLSALAMAAMLAGFYIGTLGTSLPAADTALAYNDAPYYTGSALTMAGLFGGNSQ
jgi:hypothetical protein